MDIVSCTEICQNEFIIWDALRAYGNGCGGVVAPTYGAASPVIETARRGGDYINWEIRILEVVSPRCYMFGCHL
jgi:hypothetical protein